MSDTIMRAQLLLSQGRFDLAEQELRQLLSMAPDDAIAHAMLALCLVHDQSRLVEATSEAQAAIVQEPDNPFTHFVVSIVYVERNRFDEAAKAIDEAIRLDPYDADYFGQKAAVELRLRNWQTALDAATSGLSIDAENGQCGNVRTIALERLGRSGEAVSSAAANLARDPDDASSHVAMGWALLNSGNYQQAQQAFREALRLDPDNGMARDGMIDALNSRSVVFRGINGFHIFLSRLSHKHQFTLILGAWLLVQVLARFGQQVPWLGPLVPIILMMYVVFVILTWTSNSIFNAILRFHPFGRHLLTRTQIWSSNLVATCFASGLVGAIYATFRLGLFGGIVTGFYWMLMCVPATVPFLMPTRNRAMLLAAAGMVIGLLPVYGVVESYLMESTSYFAKSMQRFNWSILGLQIAASVMAVSPNRR